jgi:hypothetical protein
MLCYRDGEDIVSVIVEVLYRDIRSSRCMGDMGLVYVIGCVGCRISIYRRYEGCTTE